MNPENPFENPFDNPESKGPDPQTPQTPQENLSLQNVNQQYGYNEEQPQFFKGQMNNMGAGGQMLPNSTGVLVLGIIGIVLCGLIGLICSIIALILANSAQRNYQADPARYTPSSYSNMKAGKICAIIGLCLQSVVLIFYIVYFVFIFGMVGAAGSGMFD